MMKLCGHGQPVRQFRWKLLGLLLVLAPTIVPAQQAGVVPNYIASMTDFEARAMAGAYAPTNGTSTMESITPADWLANDDLAAVINNWSGGAKGIGTKLFVNGGGHNGSANNGMYTFDFSGTDAPAGWETPLVISSYNAVCGGCETYADGGPTATHTGDTLVYAHHNNHIYRFTGAWYNESGGFTKANFKYNVATGEWTQLADWPASPTRVPITFYDPDTRKIYAKAIATSTGYFFRTDDDSWSGDRGISGNGAGYYVVGAWDTNRKRGIMVGEGVNHVVDIDFENETVSASPISAGGESSVLNLRAISAIYDPQADVYWLYGGRTLDASGYDYQKIYSMNANGPPWHVTGYQLTGDTVQYSNGQHGPYGRLVLMNQWRAIGMVQSHTAPVYVIKIPGEVANIVASEPPDNLVVN